jgi:anti-anti-sigma factor
MFMNTCYRQIEVERAGDVCCVRLRQHRMDESALHELGRELTHLVTEGAARRLALSLEHVSPDCLYSVFLAKLVTVRRTLQEHGGALKLCGVTPDTVGVFEACQLKSYFDFAPDLAAAVTAWAG